MAITFHFSNAVKIFRRRPRSAFRIIFAAMCATTAAAIAFSAHFEGAAQLSKLSGTITMNVFFHRELEPEEIETAASRISSQEFTDSLGLISPEQAQEEFFRGLDAPDPVLLPENPFPYAAVITLSEGFRTHQGVRMAAARLRAMPEVEDLIYSQEFADTVIRRSYETVLLSIITGVTGLIVFLFILRGSMRSELALSAGEMHVLHSMGATRLFIAAPHILFGVMCCAFGIIAGAGMSYAVCYFLSGELPWLLSDPEKAILLAAGGISILAIFSIITTSLQAARRRAVRRRIKKKFAA